MFLFKKIVSSLSSPVLVCLVMAGIGLFFLWFTRRQKTGKVFVSVAVFVIGVFSCSGISDLLVRPLEQAYPPLTDFQFLKDVKWIVVLGGGVTFNSGFPLSTCLSDASLVRLSEAIYIHNKLPQTKLILTGGSGFKGLRPVAEVMAGMALELGVKSADIIVESESIDTAAHPIYLEQTIGRDEFILVTSATHMPRAVAFLRKYGMQPIPAPTDYLAMQKEGFVPKKFFPNAGSLAKSERAIHEYLGIIWAKFRKKAAFDNHHARIR